MVGTVLCISTIPDAFCQQLPMLEENTTFNSNLGLMFAYLEHLVMKACLSRLFLILSEP